MFKRNACAFVEQLPRHSFSNALITLELAHQKCMSNNLTFLSFALGKNSECLLRSLRVIKGKTWTNF